MELSEGAELGRGGREDPIAELDDAVVAVAAVVVAAAAAWFCFSSIHAIRLRNGTALPRRASITTAYPLSSKCSTSAAPRVPVLKLSTHRTMLASKGTSVPPLVTAATRVPGARFDRNACSVARRAGNDEGAVVCS